MTNISAALKERALSTASKSKMEENYQLIWWSLFTASTWLSTVSTLHEDLSSAFVFPRMFYERIKFLIKAY